MGVVVWRGCRVLLPRMIVWRRVRHLRWLFAVARVSGWMAHLFEQYADNRLMRPLLVYTGPRDKQFVPRAERG